MAAIDWSTVLLPEPFSPTRAMIGYLRSNLVFVQPRRPSISTHSKRFGHPVEEAQRAVSLRISLLSISHASYQPFLPFQYARRSKCRRGNNKTISQNATICYKDIALFLNWVA